MLRQQLGQGLVEAQLAFVDGDADQDAQHALGHRPDVPVIGGLAALVEGQLGRAVDADQDRAHLLHGLRTGRQPAFQLGLQRHVVDPGGRSHLDRGRRRRRRRSSDGAGVGAGSGVGAAVQAAATLTAAATAATKISRSRPATIASCSLESLSAVEPSSS